MEFARVVLRSWSRGTPRHEARDEKVERVADGPARSVRSAATTVVDISMTTLRQFISILLVGVI
jgi:hypothetical protein